MNTIAKPDVPRNAGDLTMALEQWSNGRQQALDPFLPFILQELRLLARHHLRSGGRSITLDTSVLINESFVRLLGAKGATWETRSRFFAYVGTLMRNLVLDRLRERTTAQRGSGTPALQLESWEDLPEPAPADLDSVVDLDHAFKRLGDRSHRQVDVAQLRIFAGMTRTEIAEALGVSQATVTRDWTVARLFLARELHLLAKVS